MEGKMETTKRVLLVDDDDDVLEQLSAIFVADGFQVKTASSRAEGEDALLGYHPDICVFDLMMEETDAGFVLSNTSKKIYPDVPVILLTAVASATGMDFRPKSNAARAWVKADTILDKPVRPEQLREEVRKLLDC
jgi:two-component system KDP operon response regulator KdpE